MLGVSGLEATPLRALITGPCRPLTGDGHSFLLVWAGAYLLTGTALRRTYMYRSAHHVMHRAVTAVTLAGSGRDTASCCMMPAAKANLCTRMG